MQIKVYIQVPLLDMQNLVEEKEEEYILEGSCKRSPRKVTGFTSFEKVHTHYTGLAIATCPKNKCYIQQKMVGQFQERCELRIWYLEDVRWRKWVLRKRGYLEEVLREDVT